MQSRESSRILGRRISGVCCIVKEIFLLRIAFPNCLMAGDAVHTVLEQQRRGVFDSGIVMAAAKQSCSESLLLSYPNGGPRRPARKSSKTERWKPFLPRGDSNQTVQVLIVKKVKRSF